MDLKKGLVKFETYHYSPYAILKVDDQKKLKIYAEKMAVQQWADKNNRDILASNLENPIREALDKGEDYIKKSVAQNEKLIQGFIKSGLLTRGSNRFEFGQDIETRLRSLYAIRGNVLEIFDVYMPVLKTGESAEENLNEAIYMWISYGPQGRDKFYDWLKQKGYFGKEPAQEKQPIDEDENPNTPFTTGKLDIDKEVSFNPKDTSKAQIGN